MSPTSYQRSRDRLAAVARQGETEDHAWLDPDPITGRRYCRRCTAFLPGIPDQRAEMIRHRNVARALGWTEDAT